MEGVLAHPWLNCTEALDNVLPSAQMMMDKVQGGSEPTECARVWRVGCSGTAALTPVSFQAVVAGIQQAHAEQLANMRIQDLSISLKPLNSVNNPILRKRKLLGYEGGAEVGPQQRRSARLNQLPLCLGSPKPNDGFFIHEPENGGEDSNIALEKLRDVIAQCILPQAGRSAPPSAPGKAEPAAEERRCLCFAGENEDEKLNELMYEAWRINRDCELLRDGLQGLSWDGRSPRSGVGALVAKAPTPLLSLQGDRSATKSTD